MKGENMTAYIEKRASKRCSYKAPIQFSLINKTNPEDAYTINHTKSGMCIKSKHSFKVGSTVLIRIQKYSSNGSCACGFEGLPQMSLGEIKWCREISNSPLYSYKLGVKYYPSPY